MKESETRRKQIMNLLCLRRHDTIPNLAFELNVSVRTIQRDIERLSVTEPIYTIPGRHTGGVYLVEGYPSRLYMSSDESSVLEKFFQVAEQKQADAWTKEDLKALKNIILKYSKPIKKAQNRERR